ncbi:MAG TPA: hypothetical protein PK347_18530 [Burkholderiaceae bacterium]|nr:hypothetical protein [Burkholderiaceae bacterium]
MKKPTLIEEKARKYGAISSALADQATGKMQLLQSSLKDTVSDGLLNNAKDNSPVLSSETARKYGKATRAFLDKSSDDLGRMTSTVSSTLQSGLNRATKSKSLPTSEPKEFESEEARVASAIEKLKGRDKVGVVSEYATTAGGIAAGAVLAGKVAAVAGASTLFGSTTLATTLGGLFVVSTPVGWVIGSAALVGTAAYALSRLAASGAKQDVARKELIERLQKRLQELGSSQQKEQSSELQALLAIAIASQLITEDYAKRLVDMVEGGSLHVNVATNRLRDLALEAGVINPSD